MPISNTSSTSTSAQCVHHDDSDLDTAAPPEGLYQLALHGEPDAFRSRLNRLLALARSGKLSPDQLLEALMDTSGDGQTALHSGFHSTRLDKLTSLLDAVERAAEERLLEGRHVASLILKQNPRGQAALHLFGDTGVTSENLSRLCKWMLRLVALKVLTPSDAKAILSQKDHSGHSVFFGPMVRGTASRAVPAAALDELFEFSLSLVMRGAVTGDFVLSTLDKKGLRTIFDEARNPQVKATIDGIDLLLITGAFSGTPRREAVRDVIQTMGHAGEACGADSLEDLSAAVSCRAMVIDARKRWLSYQPGEALPRQGAAHTAPPPTA